MNQTRRGLLSTVAGVVGAGTLAGCLGTRSSGSGGGSGGATAQASFFVWGDAAANVAGDAATTDLLVPVGQHGHGWEPGARVREEIHRAALLLHGMEGFQPWVDRILDDLEADGSDVTAVDVSEGLDLLEPGGGHDGGHEVHGQSEDHEEGETHDEEGDGHDEDDGHDEAGDHDHHGAGMDPHFWMDPLRLKAAVGTVQQGLVAVDGDDADAYAANADAFRDRLDDLHERIESTVTAGSTDVILVAGHDAFAYLSDRYGVEVASLTDVSPDDRPTPRDVKRAQDVIDAHDLRYVCADPLESQRAAEQLVAETDAEAVLPLTSIPGLRSEWAARDWGYVEVVERVNVPTLERALEVR